MAFLVVSAHFPSYSDTFLLAVWFRGALHLIWQWKVHGCSSSRL